MPRLAGQLLTESLLLSVIGGGAGVLLAWRGISVLASLAPKELPRFDEIRMDAMVLLFGAGISLATGLFFGVLPAWRASRLDPRIDLNGAMKRPRGDLRGYIDHRFDALEQILNARFAEQKADLLRVEQVMDARLRHLEEERQR